MGIFTVDDIYKVAQKNQKKSVDKYKNMYAADCMKQAKAEPGCNFFMFNHQYPIMGCFCCTEASHAIKEDHWDIYETC